MPDATIDLFDDATSVSNDDNSNDDTSATQPDETDDTDTDGAVGTEAEEAREVLDSVPDGAMNAGDFAAYITSVQFKKAFENGEPISPSLQVIPQAIYQATQRKTNPIPFVLVGDGEGEPRKWILVAQAEEWWFNRPVSEGSSGSGSSRDPEKEARLLKEAYKAFLYNDSRAKEWADRASKKDTLVGKRTGWLAAMGGDAEAVKAEAAEEFKVEQAEKAAAKAAAKESAEENKPSDA